MFKPENRTNCLGWMKKRLLLYFHFWKRIQIKQVQLNNSKNLHEHSHNLENEVPKSKNWLQIHTHQLLIQPQWWRHQSTYQSCQVLKNKRVMFLTSTFFEQPQQVCFQEKNIEEQSILNKHWFSTWMQVRLHLQFTWFFRTFHLGIEVWMSWLEK